MVKRGIDIMVGSGKIDKEERGGKESEFERFKRESNIIVIVERNKIYNDRPCNGCLFIGFCILSSLTSVGEVLSSIEFPLLFWFSL